MASIILFNFLRRSPFSWSASTNYSKGNSSSLLLIYIISICSSGIYLWALQEWIVWVYYNYKFSNDHYNLSNFSYSGYSSLLICLLVSSRLVFVSKIFSWRRLFSCLRCLYIISKLSLNSKQCTRWTCNCRCHRCPENRQHIAKSVPSKIGNVFGLRRGAVWGESWSRRGWDRVICSSGNNSRLKQFWFRLDNFLFTTHSCIKNCHKGEFEISKLNPVNIDSWIRNRLGTDREAD